MAETMLYVNEHLHDALWDGHDDPQWIRSFRPGDYLVLTVANGESLVVSGHPAERGTFDFFIAAMGRPRTRRRPALRRRGGPPGELRCAAHDHPRLRRDDARRRDVRGAVLQAPARRRSGPSARRADRDRVGPRTRRRRRASTTAAAGRSGSRTCRGGSVRRPMSACRAMPEVPGRGQPRAARRTARLRRRPTRRSSRPTACCRAASPTPDTIGAVTLRFPVAADEGDDGLDRRGARGRRLGVRDQVGRLPHDRPRRRRSRPPAEHGRPRRHRAVAGVRAISPAR